MFKSLVRIMFAGALLVGVSANGAVLAGRSHAPAPYIIVTPIAMLPHATFQIVGEGFDPSVSGKNVIVTLSLTNSAGTVPVAAVQTDGTGAIGGPGTPPLRLPYGLDASGANQITASENGQPNLAASQLISGTALHPALIAQGNAQSPTVQAGTAIALLATGFAPSDILTLTMGGAPLSLGGSNSVTTDESGNATFSATIPSSAQSGTQLLTLTGLAQGTGQNDSASFAVTVRPAPGALSISPDPAAVGTNVMAAAGGFQPNEQVTFSLQYYDPGLKSWSVTNSPAQADASGNASAQLTIPSYADPTKPGTVSARSTTTGLSFSATLPFAVLGSISVTPANALPGALVTISGTGLAPHERLFFSSQLFAAGSVSAATDASGAFSTSATLLASLNAGQSYTLAISGSGGDSVRTTYSVGSVIPTNLRINPASAASGASVTVTGQGFGASELVGLSINGSPLSAPTSAATTDSSGAFTATATLPWGVPSGPYTVQAKGTRTGTTGSAPINITLQQSNQWYFAEGYTGQTPSVSFHETLTLLNAGAQPAVGAILYQMPDGHTRSVPAVVGAGSVLVEDVNSDIGPNQMVSAYVKMSSPILAERTITRTDATGHALDTDVSPGQTAPQSNWYFAEGYSGVTFQPYLTVQNPSSAPISMTVTLYPAAGQGKPDVIAASLVPFARYTLNLRSAFPGKSFSTVLSADHPVVAERVEYWGDGSGSAKFGAGVKPGISSPGTNWYFGYASILGGDQSFVSVLNPGAQAAHLTATVFDGAGVASQKLQLTVQPGQRGNMLLHTLLASLGRSPVAIHIASDVPVVAEEAEYFGGSPNIGSHAGASIEGRQFAASSWGFASGNTSTDQESEYILNPSSSATTVTATFYGADGQVVSVPYVVPAGQVVTVSANAVKGLHAGAHGSIWLSSNGVSVVVDQVLRGTDGRSALADQGVPW